MRAQHLANSIIILQAFLFFRLFQLISLSKKVQNLLMLVLNVANSACFSLLFKYLLLKTLKVSLIELILLI